MSNLNDLQYAGYGGPPGALPQLEAEWMAPRGLTGNQSQIDFLDGQAVGPGSLNDRWIEYWGGGGQINMPDLTLGVGSGGARHGYRRGNFGTAAPDQLVDGNEIRDLYLNNNNGRVVFKVEGTYPQDEFTSMQVVGYGTLNTADADLFDDSGGETFWRWNNTGWTWTDGDTLAVEFT